MCIRDSNVRIQDTHGLERGHRTLTLVGKGRKPATIPLPLPRRRSHGCRRWRAGLGALRDVQIAARHSDPRMTTRYDRTRGNLDHHANYIVVGFIEGSLSLIHISEPTRP